MCQIPFGNPDGQQAAVIGEQFPLEPLAAALNGDPLEIANELDKIGNTKLAKAIRNN